MDQVNSQPKMTMLPTLEQLKGTTDITGGGITISADIARTKDVAVIKEKLTRDIEEAKQAGDEQLAVLKDRLLSDIRDVKASSEEGINDLQQGLKTSVISNQKADTEFRETFHSVWNNIMDVEQLLIKHDADLKRLNDRMQTAYECLFALGVVTVVETCFLIYKFF